MSDGSWVVPDVHKDAWQVTAEGGVVFLNGLGGVKLALSPEAALEIADLLVEKGVEATGQRYWMQQALRK